MKRRTAVALFAMAAIAAPQLYADDRPPMDYYNILSEKNLFRKLGWRPPDNRPRYTLLLTAVAAEETEEEVEMGDEEVELSEEDQFLVSIYGGDTENAENTEEETAEPEEPRKNYALVSRQGSSNTYYVSEGDQFEGMTVTWIGYRNVTFENGEGEETNLGLANGFGASGGSSGRSGGGSSRSRAQTSSRSNERSSRGGYPEGMPSEMRERMERLRNASPEERAEIIRQFRGGRGGRRGGRD